MAGRLTACVWAILWIGAVSPASGLTVYRIGGESLPPPELDTPYEFVQISWSDIDAAQHGSEELLEFDPDFVRPQRFDSSVNLVPIIEEQGGQILNLVWIGWGPPQADDLFMFDQDPNTIYLGDGHFASHGPPHKYLTFDFGAPLLLERIRFFPRTKHLTDRFVETFRIGINDGDPLKDGSREFNIGRRGSEIDFDIIYDITENTEAVIDLPLPAEPVRRVLFSAAENTRGIWEIAELEIYGNGFAPFAGYVSNVIDLGALASLGELRWSGREDEGAGITLSMRSGLDADPNIYWRTTFRGGERTRFDAKGRLLTLASYNKLALGEQAGTTHDTENWAFWGGYDFTAGQGVMVGDGPQRYVQLRADFSSSQETSGQLDWVQFAVSIPPVAQQAVAEISPAVVPPGEVAAFTYKLRAVLASDDLGFDRLDIDTPVQAQSVDEVRISGVPVAFEVVRLDEAGFAVQLPRIDAQRTEELIEVDFQTAIFKFGTVFSGRISNSEQPQEVPQSLESGDADARSESNRLSVGLTRLGDQTIGALALMPSVFSPNGDGINDAVRIECNVLNLVGPVQVESSVYDLSGRRLGVGGSDWTSSGRYVGAWDGRDERGEQVPPGLYILRVSVETDKGPAFRQAVVSLAY
ncbi:MAG: hypothetical protein F4X17_18810 [Gemmatimonadetes bacterium]|nr:hypothetical protein [Gemmatimonadota bacterium]